MSTFSTRRAVAAPVLAALCAGAFAASPALAARSAALYVSPKGHDRGACTKAAPCRTIQFAVRKAKAGATVNVARATYKAGVNITRAIKLVGAGMPVIDATGQANGIKVAGPGAAGATVRGFVVEHATFEGILAVQTSRVTIRDNLVRSNNLGVKAAKPKGECAAQGQVPGDCGEGLHLMSVTHSTVRDNTVENNLGGILLTDELGPTAHNSIVDNKALNNRYDCGITIAGHSPSAYGNGTLQPAKAGVYSNRIIGNTANGNGTKGLGAGILIAAGAPGSAVYNNTVKDNTANGNGLGGFTLHSHAPGQYLNGNKVIDNSFANDGIAGNPGGKPGDVDAGITDTVGIIVFSAVTPLTGTVISGNHLSNEYYGIWTKNVPTISQGANTFASSVTVPLFQS